jgi:hypothetical protein
MSQPRRPLPQVMRVLATWAAALLLTSCASAICANAIQCREMASNAANPDPRDGRTYSCDSEAFGVLEKKKCRATQVWRANAELCRMNDDNACLAIAVIGIGYSMDSHNGEHLGFDNNNLTHWLDEAGPDFRFAVRSLLLRHLPRIADDRVDPLADHSASDANTESMSQCRRNTTLSNSSCIQALSLANLDERDVRALQSLRHNRRLLPSGQDESDHVITQTFAEGTVIEVLFRAFRGTQGNIFGYPAQELHVFDESPSTASIVRDAIGGGHRSNELTNSIFTSAEARAVANWMSKLRAAEFRVELKRVLDAGDIHAAVRFCLQTPANKQACNEAAGAIGSRLSDLMSTQLQADQAGPRDPCALMQTARLAGRLTANVPDVANPLRTALDRHIDAILDTASECPSARTTGIVEFVRSQRDNLSPSRQREERLTRLQAVLEAWQQARAPRVLAQQRFSQCAGSCEASRGVCYSARTAGARGVGIQNAVASCDIAFNACIAGSCRSITIPSEPALPSGCGGALRAIMSNPNNPEYQSNLESMASRMRLSVAEVPSSLGSVERLIEVNLEAAARRDFEQEACTAN